jgi:hypothetical protein
VYTIIKVSLFFYEILTPTKEYRHINTLAVSSPWDLIIDLMADEMHENAGGGEVVRLNEDEEDPATEAAEKPAADEDPAAKGSSSFIKEDNPGQTPTKHKEERKAEVRSGKKRVL